MIDLIDIADCLIPPEPEPYDPARQLAIDATQVGRALIERGVIVRKNRKWILNPNQRG
jgi:hypothetical protein